MKCPNCGTEIDDGAKFCSSCGKPVSGNGNDAAGAAGTENTAENTGVPVNAGAAGNGKTMFSSIDEMRANIEKELREKIENDKKVAAPVFPESYLYSLMHTKKIGTMLAVWSTLFSWMCFVTVFNGYDHGGPVHFAAIILCVVAFIFGKNEKGDRSHILLFNLILSIVNFLVKM